MLSQIDGVLSYPIVTLPDERGCVWKFHPAPFDVKDVYVTTVHPGAIKAWHGYETKQIYYSVLQGMVKLVLWDSRKTSLTSQVIDELFLGVDGRFSVLIPPGVFAGFKGISNEDAIVVVQTSEPYDSNRVYRIPYDQLPYDWGIKHG